MCEREREGEGEREREREREGEREEEGDGEREGGREREGEREIERERSRAFVCSLAPACWLHVHVRTHPARAGSVRRAVTGPGGQRQGRPQRQGRAGAGRAEEA